MRDSVPSASYSSVCNVLRQCNIPLIPTYRVYRLYDRVYRLYDIEKSVPLNRLESSLHSQLLIENVLEQGPDFCRWFDTTQFSYIPLCSPINTCKDVFNPNVTTFCDACPCPVLVEGKVLKCPGL